MKKLLYCFLLLCSSVAAQTAPSLVMPANEDSIVFLSPIFSWTPAMPTAGVRYNFLLVERLKIGNQWQTATQALLSNPVLFQQQNLTNPVLIYPSNAPVLQVGKSYAWQVTFQYNAEVSIQGGVSEPSIFYIPIVEQEESPIISSNVFLEAFEEPRKTNYYVTTDIIPVRFKNYYHFPTQFKLTNSKHEMINISSISSVYGVNQLEIHVPGLPTGEYLLEMNNAQTQKLFVRFQKD